MSGWPAELRLKTRKILDGRDPFPKCGILPMKDVSGFSAYLKQADLRNGLLILYDSKTQLATYFQSAGELFDAGWVANLQPDFQFHHRPESESMTALHNVPATVENQPANTVTTEANKVVSLTTGKVKERAC